MAVQAGVQVSAATTTMAAKRRGEAIAGFLFMSPSLAVLTIFLIIPILIALLISFTNWDGIRPLAQADAFQGVGLENYADLILNPGIVQEDFFKAFKNTAYYTLGVVPLQTFLSLALAVIVNQRWLKGKGFFRTAFYFPSITSSVVISLIFMWMFSRGGLINTLIQGAFPAYQRLDWLNNSSGVIHSILGLTIRNAPDWLRQSEIAGLSLFEWISGPSVTLMMIMLLAVWTTTGTMMVIFLSALQGIPRQVYEAAFVDGATAWQTFRHITVPLLRPTTFFVISLGLIGCFQVFDQIFVISSGGPAKTTLTISYVVYVNGFKNASMGLATATAIVLFFIIFGLTLLQRRMTSDKGEM